MQKRKLHQLLLYVNKYNRYYQELFNRENIEIHERLSEEEAIEILKKIPLLTKDILCDFPPERFISEHHSLDALIRESTSGSSGKRISVYLTKKEKFKKDVIRIRSQLFSGYNPFHKRMQCGGFSEDTPIVVQKLGLLRKKTIVAKISPEDTVAEIKKYKPKCLIGFPSYLRQIAERIGSNKIHVNLVITLGEILDNATRKMFQETFNARVRDHYGAVELGRLAFEGDRTNLMHLNEDWAFFETTETGELVVTALDLFAMPIIRYNLGDIVSIEEPQGRLPFRTIKSIEGRRDDFIFLKNGNKLSPTELLYWLYHNEHIKEFQVIQKSKGAILIKIIAKDRFSKEQFKTTLERHIRWLNIEIDLVSKIERTAAGKLKSVICDI
jgi:phenylacetate-CoA ligase